MRLRRSLALGAVAAATATSLGGAAAADVAGGDGNVTVSVPVIGYVPQGDRFRAGPYRSRLHVLANDAGISDGDRLQLVNARGRPVPAVVAPRVGRLTVAGGYVVLDPVPGASGEVTFSYRAASPNGPVLAARAVVRVFPRAVVVADDSTRTPEGAAVTLDVAANDRIVAPGASLACPPQLFARRPPRADPLPIVLPEPARQPVECAPTTPLVRPAGEWRVAASGKVRFTPRAGFTGTARAYYRQVTDYPFDLGVARMQVSVGAPAGSDVLGVRIGRPQAGRTAGGDLAATGGRLLAPLLTGASLAGAGLGLRWAARRRRQPPAREA